MANKSANSSPAAPAASASAASAPVSGAPVQTVVSGNQAPTVSSASEAAARLAFFKVMPEQAPTEVKPVAAQAAAAAPAPVAAPTETEALPVYQEPVEVHPDDSGGTDEAFTTPAWINSVPAESRVEAEKFAKGQYEQTAKHKKRSSEAVADKAKAVSELEAANARLKELEVAPLPVAVPELSLSNLRTSAEVDAFVESAPKELAAQQAWERNCRNAIKTIESDGDVTLFGKKWQADDIPTIQAEMARAQEAQAALQADIAATPKRREYLAKHGEAVKEAEKQYPAMFDGRTDMAKAKAKLLSESPSLAAAPNHPVIIGDHLTMRMVRAGKYKLVPTNPKAVEAPKTNAPASAGQNGVSAPTPQAEADATKNALEALKAKANAGDRAAKEQLRLSYFKVA